MKITLTRIVLFLLVLATVVFLCWFFRVILMYIICAAVLSLVADPLCRRIDNLPIYKGKSLPSWAAALLTMLIIVGVISGILSIFIPVLVQEANTIANLDRNQVMQSLQGPLDQLEGYYTRFNIGDDKPFKEFVVDSLKNMFSGGEVTTMASGVFNSVSSIVAALFSIFFIAFFLLKEEGLLKKVLLMMIPKTDEKKAVKIFTESKQLLVKYLVGLLIQFLAVTTLASLGMWVFGISNPLLMGVLFGLLNLIPYVGPLIANGIGIVIAITTNLNLGASEWWPIALKVLVIYSVVQFIDNWFLSNYIFSKSMEAHP
ncbi:MAG: AI-2E family transporter [Sphingobacteriales bacterium JAD_PAG50586_3]|nr:MAG: AI-2E family transporter [Sphingobacteriales bacterium JAD_PAG50586_3]